MKVIDLINMINNKEDLPEKMIINKIEFHSNVFKTMIYEEDCNTNIWMAIQLNHIDLDDYVKIMEVELIEDETIDIDNINLDKIIKVFEDIEMCLDRLSVKISSAGQGSIDNYLDRYKYDLQAVKQLNKEIKSIKEK